MSVDATPIFWTVKRNVQYLGPETQSVYLTQELSTQDIHVVYSIIIITVDCNARRTANVMRSFI